MVSLAMQAETYCRDPQVVWSITVSSRNLDIGPSHHFVTQILASFILQGGDKPVLNKHKTMAWLNQGFLKLHTEHQFIYPLDFEPMKFSSLLP